MGHDCSFLTDLLDADQVGFDATSREDHTTDMGTPSEDATQPDAVVWPESTEDVSAVLAAANERGVPVTPYAAGTSLEGNAAPVHGGISLDLMRMNDVLDVRPEDFQIDVEPGVMGTTVDETVASEGLFFPPLPSSGDISTIGGMIVNDASGMQTVKYGEIHDWVLELEVVLADGSVVRAGSKAKKTSSGYNLVDLFVGSEGTLGVVTRATLELEGRPEQIRGGRAVFPDLDSAAAAVSDAIQSGVDVARIELLDELSGAIATEHFGLDLPAAPIVFLEFHANHGIEEEIDFCETIFAAHDVVTFELADEAEMDELWQARRELGLAVGSYDEDRDPIHAGDVTVPISKLPDVIRYAKELEAEHDMPIPCFGHVGDGNVHYLIMAEDDPESQALAEELYGEIVEYAIGLGGTATGEHGVGLGKRPYMLLEHGEAGVAAMRRIKAAFDPNDILNPGKMFPETVEEGRVDLDGVRADPDD
ncbi:MAG: FAD-binding oxidoreductase [Haloarculaceae archaeon]